MRKFFLQSLRLTFILMILLCVIYPLIVAFAARMSGGGGNGEALYQEGRKIGYANLGQSFTKPQYFWGRPSAARYNAAGSAGSNKSAYNKEYLRDVENRIDTLLKYNPGLTRDQIPADMVTASGSGLDPDISVQGAKIQAARIAAFRKISIHRVYALIRESTQGPLLGLFGPEKVNVLQLNLSLDKLSDK